MKTFHQLTVITSSCFRTATIEKMNNVTRLSQISKAVNPNHLMISFNVKNMVMVVPASVYLFPTWILQAAIIGKPPLKQNK